jgi:hypothetical protein
MFRQINPGLMPARVVNSVKAQLVVGIITMIGVQDAGNFFARFFHRVP